MSFQVNEFSSSLLTIKKSKFLSFLMPINTLTQVKDIISEFKSKYKDASHVCYGYIIDENNFKYYDDGEPSFSAGLPIYQALKSNDLSHTLCIVVRYFGGIKLGVGGLIRAYNKSACLCIEQASLIEYRERHKYLISISYSNLDSLLFYLKNNNIEITNKDFQESTTLSVSLSKKERDEIIKKFNNMINIKAS